MQKAGVAYPPQQEYRKFRDGNEVKTLNVAGSDTASPAIFFRQTMTSELFRKF